MKRAHAGWIFVTCLAACIYAAIAGATGYNETAWGFVSIAAVLFFIIMDEHYF